jgi:hypothetical protein
MACSENAMKRLHWSNVQQTNWKILGFEALTAVTIRSVSYRDVTPCSLIQVYRCFGGKYYVNLQGRRVSEVIK